MKLRSSGEDYLEAILILQKEKGAVRAVDVAHYLDVTRPSVSHAVAVLQEGGFLTTDQHRLLQLTEAGAEIAEATYEKHKFFTELLVSAGVDIKTAEHDACRMEHAISETSFHCLKKSIGKFWE